MDMVNKAFIETMIEGDSNGRGFQYPIPTYSITKDFDWSDTENNRLLFEMTAKYGTPYFPIISILTCSPVMSAVCAADCVWICGNCARRPEDFRFRREHRKRGRCHHQYAQNRISVCQQGRVLRKTEPHDGHCSQIPEDQARCHYEAAERGTVSLYQAVSGNL